MNRLESVKAFQSRILEIVEKYGGECDTEAAYYIADDLVPAEPQKPGNPCACGHHEAGARVLRDGWPAESHWGDICSIDGKVIRKRQPKAGAMTDGAWEAREGK